MKEVDQLEKLEEQGPLNQEQRKTLGNYKAVLQEIYKRKEIMRCQRARIKWLKERDANTAFFHRTANMRRRHNTIHSLVVGNRTKSDENNIWEHIYTYFKKIFGE